MNFLEKRVKKSGKTTYDVAKKMGISENKLKDALNGKRQLKGDNFDKFLKATEKTKKDTFSELEMKTWYATTDIKKLRIDFGYTLKELCNEIDVPIASLNRIENRKQQPGAHLQKIYDFFNDDLNKKTDKHVYKNGRKPKKLESLEMDLKDVGHKKKDVKEEPKKDVKPIEIVEEKPIEVVKEENVEPIKEIEIFSEEPLVEEKPIIEDVEIEKPIEIEEDIEIVDRLIDVEHVIIDNIVRLNEDETLTTLVRANMIYNQTSMLLSVLEEERRERENRVI